MATSRKMLTLLISLVLAFGLMPLPAFAGNADGFNVVADVVENDASTQVESSPSVDEAIEAQVATQESERSNAPETPVDLSVVSFVYVEAPNMGADSSQNIVVGFADDASQIQDAQLDLVAPDGGIIQIDQRNGVEGAVLFTIPGESLPLGTYAISALHYRIVGNEVVYVAAFSLDEVVNYEFEVVESSDIVAGEGGVVTGAYTLNPDGEYVEAASIGEAMAAAGIDPNAGPGVAPSGSANEDAMAAQSADGFVVVLDPGHGGSDGGAGGYGLEEKYVNLKIAEYCKAKLEQTPGVTVYMTRTNDSYVSLSDRTAFAVNHNADLVVSIHNNSGGGSGSEVIVPRGSSWYYNETYVTGHELGQRILSKLNALGLGTHQGVYSRDSTNGSQYPDGSLSDYYSLVEGPRKNGILGIIVEHAFIDNAGDVAYLGNDDNLRRLGEADASAIIEYYNSSEGIDRVYWPIYNYEYYTSHYPDVENSAGNTRLKTLAYFKSTGMSAGHRGNAMFDVSYYKANNPDLQNAFGSDLPRYYQHFIDKGMKEGRQGSADFSPVVYKANYGDLAAAFGDDWERYYRHYYEYGMREGRSGKGAGSATTSAVSASGLNDMYRLYNPNSGEHFYTAGVSERDYLVRAGWKYEGVAWQAPAASSTPVFRLYNPNAGDHHYTMGASERDYLVRVGWRYEGIGWYSDDAKGAPLYRLYNPNAETGTHHYTIGTGERDYLVNVGWKYEGLAWYGVGPNAKPVSAVVAGDEAIMGSSQTSVAQMIRRYNSVGKTYPSGTYSKYGAAGIEQFCQILYEEATAEGVRPEVVFAQAMHETGWLQFGGSVNVEQCNFAGIGATEDGVSGAYFNTYGANSVRMGLRAQVQHLKAYASTDSCKNSIVDPRFGLVSRGSATTVKALSGKWATGSGYGDALVNHIQALLKA